MTKKADKFIDWKDWAINTSIGMVVYYSLGVAFKIPHVALIAPSVFLGTFIAIAGRLAGHVWKNLYKTPGFYTIKQNEISLDSNEAFLYLSNKDRTRTCASFTDSTRVIETYKYNIEYDAPNPVIFDAEYENAIHGLHAIHELGHAYSAKWVQKYFWDKNKNRRLFVADEIVRRVEAIIGFARITQAEREKIHDVIMDQAMRMTKQYPDKSVDEIFTELTKRSHILRTHQHVRKFVAAASGKPDKEYDIFDKEYIDDFNAHWQDKHSHIVDMIVNSLKIDFVTDGLVKGYVKSAKKNRLKNKLFSIDFYGRPVKFDEASIRIFDIAADVLDAPIKPGKGFVDATNRVNLLPLMSDVTKDLLWQSIDRWIEK